MAAEQRGDPKEVPRDLGICIDTLRSWLKGAGMQMGQVSRHNQGQHRIGELEAELLSLHKQLSEKDEVIDILEKPSTSCRNHRGEVLLRPGATSPGIYCEQACRVLEVSRSGYYGWVYHKPCRREQSNQTFRR